MRIVHARVSLALHELRSAEGPPLLLLHPLRGSSAHWGDAVGAWPGRVLALDFCGHGASGWLKGGGYLPELFAADADAALAEIGPASLAGAGVGAYAALLLAGGRPEQVPAALLLPGAGLAGGGARPDFDAFAGGGSARVSDGDRGSAPGTDPLVRTAELDVRPTDYAESFAAAAKRLLLAEDGSPRPPWWEAVRASPHARRAPADLSRALAALARCAVP